MRDVRIKTGSVGTLRAGHRSWDNAPYVRVNLFKTGGWAAYDFDHDLEWWEERRNHVGALVYEVMSSNFYVVLRWIPRMTEDHAAVAIRRYYETIHAAHEQALDWMAWEEMAPGALVANP